MAQIKCNKQYDIHIYEYQRPYIEAVLRSAKERLEEDLDLAKCDEDEDKAELLQEKIDAINGILDDIDLQHEEFQMEADNEEWEAEDDDDHERAWGPKPDPDDE